MKYDNLKYKIYNWKNWMMLHWIINPGLAINEVFLGQRIPKISLEDKTSNKPRVERTFVPCPHCDTLHDGRTWSAQNSTAYKNWFGLYCSNCGGIIPCMMNGVTFIIVILSSPVWYWFYKSALSKWLEKQPSRYENINLDGIPNPYDNKSWVFTGLSWGAFMFLIMTIIFPFVQGQEISAKSLLIGAVVWTIGGLIFGYTLFWYLKKKGKPASD